MSNTQATVEDLIDELTDVLEKGWHLPFAGGKSFIDSEDAKQILDEIREAIPSEVRKAKAIVADRAQIISEAQREAETIVRVAEEKAKALVNQEEIVRQAQAKLIAAGFKLTENRMVSGEKDWVYGVIYQGRQLQIGDKAPIGATLTLMVGDGVQSTATDSVDMVENAAMSVEDSGTDDDSWF